MYEFSFLSDFATSLAFLNSVLWKNWLNILFHMRKIESKDGQAKTIVMTKIPKKIF